MARAQTIHVIAGPTASGKSARALDLAEELGGVVINADSVQLYDALPILSARPPPGDMARAPHRLYGTQGPNAPLSAGNWRKAAEPIIAEALAAGAAPIVVGGSGLYLKALLEGLSPIPDVPDGVRAAAAAERERLGPEAFFQALAARDPEGAARLHPGHTARVLRAWEVLEATGRTLTELQAAPPEPPPAHWRFDVTVLMPAREALCARCDARFGQMLEAGALAEAAGFEADVAEGRVREGVPVARTLGLAPLRAHLRGEMGLEAAAAQARADTRRYAKRQVTWLRHQLRAGPRARVTVDRYPWADS